MGPPYPHLTAVFPVSRVAEEDTTAAKTSVNGSEASVAQVTVQLMSNGNLQVVSHDIALSPNGTDQSQEMAARAKTAMSLAKGLDICEDLGVWVEWVRKM